MQFHYLDVLKESTDDATNAEGEVCFPSLYIIHHTVLHFAFAS